MGEMVCVVLMLVGREGDVVGCSWRSCFVGKVQ